MTCYHPTQSIQEVHTLGGDTKYYTICYRCKKIISETGVNEFNQAEMAKKMQEPIARKR